MNTKKSYKKITFWENLFFYQVSSETQKTQKKLKSIWKHILIIMFISLVIYIFSTYNYKMTNHFGTSLFKKNLQAMFTFSNLSTLDYEQSLVVRSFKILWFTIKYTVTGTFFGFILALLTASLTNRTFTNKIWSFFSRNLILLLRSIPELLFISLFTSVFRSNASLILIFIWFTWLWLHKYYIEALESIDTKPFYIAINQGNSKFKAFYKEVYPRLINRFISLFIYSFESNMRWGSILSTLGAPGIGVLINYAGKSTAKFKELGIPLTILLVFILGLELLNIVLNKYLFQINSKTIKTTNINKLAKTINWRFYIKILFMTFLSIFSFVIIIITDKSYLISKSSTEFFKALFSPDWSAFNWNSLKMEENPLLQVLQVIEVAISTMTITIILSLAIIPFCCLFTNKYQSNFIFKALNSFNRLIPSVVLIYLFSALANSKLTLIVFVLGIHEASGFIKQITETIDNIDEQKIKNLKLMGYSNWRIYWKFILPSIKYDFIALTFFYLELAFRNAITYSVFTSSKDGLYLGQGLYNALEEKSKQIYVASVYFWLSTLLIFSLNISSEFIVNKWVKQKSYFNLKLRMQLRKN